MTDDSLSTFRRGHLGRALFRARAVFEEQFAARIRAAGFDDFRKTDVDIIARLPSEGGARVTEIASQMPVSKQAVAKAVESLVGRGYLLREPDPTDGRAHRLVYSRRGEQFLAQARVVIGEIEAEWEDRLGEQALENLKSSLFLVADALGPEETL